MHYQINHDLGEILVVTLANRQQSFNRGEDDLWRVGVITDYDVPGFKSLQEAIAYAENGATEH